MSALSVFIQGLVDPVALRVNAASNLAYVALRAGGILRIDFATGAFTQVGIAPGRINDFDVTDDGSIAYIVGAGNSLWRVPLDGSAPTQIARRMRLPNAVTIDRMSGEILVAEANAPGRLL